MANDRSKTIATAVWLGLFFALALTLRVVFNVGVAFDEGGDEDGRYLYSGNDPWYHHRTVDHILTTGESLTFDPAINYPNGGQNPNPPIYDWLTAIDAHMIDAAGFAGSTSLALNQAVAFWGAAIVFPVFMIGNSLWGRSAGLWAAMFMAVSAPHIQRSVFGFADHDAPALFFIALCFAFLLTALRLLKKGEFVPSWKNNPMDGIRRAFTENKQSMLWAALSGVALSAVALTWKGYPYALGVLALAFGFQLLVDHARNKDSTALTMVYLIPVVMTLVISFPYYTTLGFISSTVEPNLWALIGMLVAAVVLVPTRELPSIMVFPALVLAGVIGLLFLLFVVPSVGQTIFTGLGYFQTSKLYSTVSEAQRTELGFVAANFGFFTFLLAFWYLYRSGRSGFKGDAPNMLMFAWATLAIFMAFAAGRFVFNASPVFALLAGAGTAHIMRSIGGSETWKAIRNYARQGNPIGAFFRGLTPKTTFGTLAVVGILVLPNVWLGVDAGMSFDYEREKELDNSRLGAFGTSFDLHRNGWLELFDELASRDTELAMADRPAFIAWWDYGHWATAIGKHPTVADPFQNHFEIAGRFLSAESEEEAMIWLTLLIYGPKSTDESVRAVWTAHGVDPNGIAGNLDARYEAVADDIDDAFATYNDMTNATGDYVGYFAVDSRMFPQSGSNTGIFYAPVFLANKNPDDFLIYTYSSQSGLFLTLHQYGVDEDGNSYRLDQPEYYDTAGNRWSVINGQAYRFGQEPVVGSSGSGGIPVQVNFQLSGNYGNTMYAKAYGGINAAATTAGEGLSHWRVIHESINGGARATVLLEYVPGGITPEAPAEESEQAPEGAADNNTSSP